MSPTGVTTRTGGNVSREGAKTRSCHAKTRRREVENRLNLGLSIPRGLSSRLRAFACPPPRLRISA